MKEESHTPRIDPSLEARIAALVLGEASDFERDELTRLIQQRPELAALKKQIQSVHGLLQDVGVGESVAEDDDWKLPAERRASVLAVIRGEAKGQPKRQVVNKTVEKRGSVKGNFLWNFTKVAAVFCVAGFFGSMLFLASRPRVLAHLDSARLAETRQPQSNQAAVADSASTSEPLFGGTSLNFSSDDAIIVPTKKNKRSADPAAVTKYDYEQNSKSSLSAIRDNLGPSATPPNSFYLADDVQYFPNFPKVPGVDLPQGADAPRQSREADKQNPRFAEQVNSPEPGSWQTLESPRIMMEEESSPLLSAEGVLEGETILGSEIQRRVESRGEPRTAGEPVVSSPAPAQDLGESVIENKPLNAAGMGIAGSRYGDQSVLGKQTESFGLAMGGEVRTLNEENQLGWRFRTLPPSGSQEAAPEPESRRGGSLQLGVTPRIIIGPEEPLAAGIDEEIDGIAAGGMVKGTFDQNMDMQGMGGGGFGGGAASTGGRKSEISAGQELPQIAQQESDAWFDMDVSNGAAPSKPMAAGSAGRTGKEEAVSRMLEDGSGSMGKRLLRKPMAPAGLNEKNAEDEAFSTFSLHVSDVSFKLASAALAQGEWPEAAKVRIEEFVNAFDYGDPMPSQSEKVACSVEQSIHPFLQQRNLLRVSMRTAAAGRSSNTPLRLTLLLDNSGSMERTDRQRTVRRAFALLAQQLKPIDQVTLISFARRPRLLADKVSGAQSSQLVELVDNLPSEGGTNIEAALQLAFEKAQEQQVEGAQNRIILLTDGAVNLGDANPESLSRMIATMRDAGIAFDAAGISAEGLNDEVLEALTRQGDGRYYLLDSPEAADDGFARQIAGALRPSAKNVKVQIEFNPKRVGRYKLLGFEKHRLKQEDFRNDKVDAAEMAAAEAGVAVYQFEAKPDGEGDVGSVSVRFRDLSTGQMIENRWPIPYEPDAPRTDQAAPSLRIATSAALLAAKLRGEPLGDSVDLKTLADLIAGLPDRDRNANRVEQLQLMIGQARQVSGK